MGKEDSSLRILQIAPFVPYPPNFGGAMGIFNITKHLALRGHAVHLCYPSPNGDAPPVELLKFCTAKAIPSNTGHSPFKLLAAQFGSTPYMVRKYANRSFAEAIRAECAAFRPDIVHVDYPMMAQFALPLRKEFGIPVVLREHDIETKLFERMAVNERNPVMRIFLNSEYRRMRKYEPAIARQFDRCVTTTPNDEAELKRLAVESGLTIENTAAIPAGVEIPGLFESANGNGNRNVLWIANLEWKPNVDGFLWFYREILPLLVRSNPDVIVSVVGRGKSSALASIRDQHVRFIGQVDDVGSYLRDADVCIVPLRTGSGVRIKILEMFAHAKAVVSTSVGAEGIDAKNGEHLLIVDDPREFASAVSSLLADTTRRRVLGKNGRALVEAKYDWREIASQFEDLYRSCLAANR